MTEQQKPLSAAPELSEINARSQGRLPGLLGIIFTHAERGLMRAHLDIREEVLAPNGFLHAATVIGLADTACGYGTILALPAGAHNFTTIELKSNFLSTARSGQIEVEAKLIHAGRTTQVWDAQVSAAGKTLALFRCTQAVLYPR
ncbi:PaaI family thioesterase [Deinococcus detaillensis]|uniref:PaaI family thioesterase n=1 Tax=Deinococcus detaillensis TaxID=2592048 RepID=A0A553V4F3_9DEIO|nr:PaaI family thioesterase [Deinococcus detaillensis]TSA87335.1 PaaI family thioesterase [Deinococcus detaillensis]